ncbi:MAG: proline--tRNA ligase [Candidatus Hydrothermales bacterium]
MKFNRSFIKTLRENPKDADNPAYALLLRAGYIRKISAGVFLFLPLGLKSIKKIEKIVREEMDRIGAQEMLFSALSPKSIWEESGRWESFGDDMFRLKDRKNSDFALSPTHEEIVTFLARDEIRSFRELPQIWYQIQTKFRDEPRPRGGLLRCREFSMKDSYSLDATWEGLDESYNKHKLAYERIFKRCGLKFHFVQASSGLMGGKESGEFMVESEWGEDKLVICPKCSYKANKEVAKSKPKVKSYIGEEKKEKVYTPGIKSAKDVSSFLSVPLEGILKSILVLGAEKPILAVVRGDYELHIGKLSSLLNSTLKIADPDEVKEILGVSAGFVGPLNSKVPIIIDEFANEIIGGVAGAGEEDYHVKGITPSKDFKIERVEDIKEAKEGDLCYFCSEELIFKNAIEIGHIFKLGTRYSESMGAYFTDKNGKRKPIIMGSYGIGIGRILLSAASSYMDENGLSLPITIAPFDVHIVDFNLDKTITKKIEKEFKENDLDYLIDDRDETPGVKFKDADLIGIPIRVTLGKNIKKDLADIFIREKKEKIEVNLKELKIKVKEIVEKKKKELNDV